MSKTILLVDADGSILAGLPESLQRQYSFQWASSYHSALTRLESADECCLIIAELGLDNQNGITFLNRVRKDFPKTVRMVMTAHNDFSDVYDALNTAEAYRFIKKPCPPDALAKLIRKGLRKYKSDKEKQQAMRKALLGSVKAMVDILDMVNPEAMGFATRIRKRVIKTGRTLKFRPLWQLELAVQLSHIGCVALPSEVLMKVDTGDKLSPEEEKLFGMHPQIASNLLANINQMAPVAEIVRQQHDFLNGDQPLGSRIIKVALDLDRLERAGNNPLTILDSMAAEETKYDLQVVEAMRTFICPTEDNPISKLDVGELHEGMVIAKDLVNNDGTKLLLRGQSISKASLARLKTFHRLLGITAPIHVTAESENTCTSDDVIPTV